MYKAKKRMISNEKKNELLKRSKSLQINEVNNDSKEDSSLLIRSTRTRSKIHDSDINLISDKKATQSSTGDAVTSSTKNQMTIDASNDLNESDIISYSRKPISPDAAAAARAMIKAATSSKRSAASLPVDETESFPSSTSISATVGTSDGTSTLLAAAHSAAAAVNAISKSTKEDNTSMVDAIVALYRGLVPPNDVARKYSVDANECEKALGFLAYDLARLEENPYFNPHDPNDLSLVRLVHNFIGGYYKKPLYNDDDLRKALLIFVRGDMKPKQITELLCITDQKLRHLKDLLWNELSLTASTTRERIHVMMAFYKNGGNKKVEAAIGNIQLRKPGAQPNNTNNIHCREIRERIAQGMDPSLARTEIVGKRKSPVISLGPTSSMAATAVGTSGSSHAKKSKVDDGVAAILQETAAKEARQKALEFLAVNAPTIAVKKQAQNELMRIAGLIPTESTEELPSDEPIEGTSSNVPMDNVEGGNEKEENDDGKSSIRNNSAKRSKKQGKNKSRAKK